MSVWIYFHYMLDVFGTLLTWLSAATCAGLMSIAWSVTEVIRYSWYALKEATGFAPFPLTWCRYVPSIQHFSLCHSKHT